MAIKLSIPGKSFLAGEYLALEGGPSLVAALGPRFILEAARETDKSSLDGILPESPAGLFYAKHRDSFQGYQLQFIDPHHGVGGWGASTAQFACLYALGAWRESIITDAEKQLDLREMLGAYREICQSKSGATPSGADLVAQVRGGLTFFDRKKGQLKCYGWPFDDIGVAFIRTGEKLATHEHLEGITDTSFAQDLVAPVVMAREAIEMIDSKQFVRSIELFRQSLCDKNLEHKKTKSLIESVRGRDFCLAAKGCGALGVDTLMLVHPTSLRGQVRAWVNERGLELVATEEDLESGIDLKMEAGFAKGFASPEI